MGFFDGLISKENLSELQLELKSYERIIKDLKNNENITDELRENILGFINDEIFINGEFNQLQFSSEDFAFVLGLYSSVKDRISFDVYIDFAKNLYDKLVIDKKDRSQKQFFNKVLRVGVNKGFDFLNLLLKKYNFIFDIFERKELFLSFIENVPSNMNDYFVNQYLSYVIVTRKYYVDEIQFLTRIISIVKVYYNRRFDTELVQTLLSEDMRNAGIYDVSMEDIERIEKSIRDIKEELNLFGRAKDGELERINKEIATLEGGYKSKIDNKFALIDGAINGYREEVVTSKSDMKNYTEESKVEVKKYFDSLVKTMEELKKELDTMTLNLVHGQTVKLTEDYQMCVTLINDMMKGTMNDKNIQYKISQLGEILLRMVSIINDKKDEIKNEEKKVEQEVQSQNSVNKYLDPSKSLRERLDAALANKDPNAIYHSSVDKVVKELLNSNTVYLVGPSGCCKTYSVRQIAELLELPLYDFGFVTDEHETFKSYKDVHGNFVKNVFYEAYKNGGICFFDEIDNSESKALVELNRIIGGNGEYEAYLFPNGELVYPHPNLRIIVAGNTYGDGASEAYSTRERLDFGTIDRFQAIEYYYDTELEKKVLEYYPLMFDFCMAYRSALTNIGYEYTLTTRRIFKIKKNLDSGCYSTEEIVYDFFISSLRLDVLENIKSYMSNNLGMNSYNEYFDTFVKIINSKNNNGYTKKRGC